MWKLWFGLVWLMVGCAGSQPCDDVLSLVPDPIEGEIWYGNRCRTCHGVSGEGTEDGPAIAETLPGLERCEIANQILQGGTEMPPFEDVLEPQAISDLVEWLALEFQ